MVPVAPHDIALALGSALTLGSTAWVLWPRPVRLGHGPEGLTLGARLVPWDAVHSVEVRRGLERSGVRVTVEGGHADFPLERVDGDPVAMAAEVARRHAEARAGAEALEPPATDAELPPELPPGLQEPPAEGGARRSREGARRAQGRKQRSALGATIAGVLVALKFGAKFGVVALKFGANALKLGKLGPTAWTMLLSLWVYAQLWGWVYAAGFLALLMIHELGHAAVFRARGIPTSPIVFIPLMGAVISVKERLRDAGVEAETAYGGPVVGSLAALLCFFVYRGGGSELWLALAYTGFLLNLFNLLPVPPLDGGRVTAAISPWLWLPGLAGAGWMAFSTGHPILVLVVILGAIRAWSAFRGKDPEARPGYYEVAPAHRLVLTVCYFGLCGFLAYMTRWSLELMASTGVV